MQDRDIEQIATLAEELADRARPLALRYFRQGGNIEYKGDGSPVTIADREIEDLLRQTLEDRRPGDKIFGEERGGDAHGEIAWILDPIDGTKSFASGNPLFGCLIGVAFAGQPWFGLIDMPALSERWIGTRHVARYQGQPTRVSQCVDLHDARLYCTLRDRVGDRLGIQFSQLAEQVAFTRYGGDCYSFGLLASGYCDLCIEDGLKPYDYMAVVPIIEGAGGVVSDWSGRPLTVDSDGSLVAAATRELWEQALSIVGDRPA